MINLLKYASIFILYVLLQVLILNKILFLGFINPYLYILYIITLPSSVSKDTTLFTGFFMGLAIDIFSGTPGFNAFATVLISYLKPYLQKAFGPRDEHELTIIPSFKTYGVGMFLQYATFLVLIHHAAFFIIETGTLADFGFTLLKIVCSAAFTLLLIVSLEFFKWRR